MGPVYYPITHDAEAGMQWMSQGIYSIIEPYPTRQKESYPHDKTPKDVGGRPLDLFFSLPNEATLNKSPFSAFHS